ERPEVASRDASWSAPADTRAIDPEPWRGLGDPLLVELIERAASHNLDLRQAEARLREARAGRDVAAGRRLPDLAATGSATRQQLSENGQLPFDRFPGFDRSFSLFDVGFDASWEIDLWGGTRRAVEAATRRMAAAAAEHQDVRLRVVAEVERTYAELRGAQAEAAVLAAEAATQRRLADLMRQRRNAGEVALSDEAQAEAQAHSAEAALPGIEAQIHAAAHGLAVLTGQPPEALRERLLKPAVLPLPPAQVSAGLRSDILRRRPDVIAAEAQLAAAIADVGVETANLFPQISLIGSVGQQARGGTDLLSSGSTRYQLGPMLRWPIFSDGRIRAQIRAADARADAAAAQYEQAVLAALADSETALNRYNAAVAAAREMGIAREQAAKALALAEQRYTSGEDDLLQYLLEQSRFNGIARVAATTERDRLVAHAALVKALGGGWQGQSGDPADEGSAQGFSANRPKDNQPNEVGAGS
ncbi:MAG TPA: efflux transporter outer membrane subunit, partial [Pedomonas sp.]|uniref:efflux transporter outer membrane subunit n=1 Tax=Pedomonas sp. TaxID=2976421 RepID=UPI002F3E8015